MTPALAMQRHKTRVVVIGLGYVGLPLAMALAEVHAVTGFDIDRRRIDELRSGHDRTAEVDKQRLKQSSLVLTADPAACCGADVYVVTVPTPVDSLNRPDLAPLASAARGVSAMIEPGRATLVIFESTVYPGLTEDFCLRELEADGRLHHGRDFCLGYSPERINPGDPEHSIDRIVKVVSGENEEALERVAALYEPITRGGIFRAKSIKAAEAAKVIENAQRDVNIAFVNEITQIFAELDLSIWDVLAAARTKWNFLDFQPGLVGGHCIGVDPYYLSHIAKEVGRDPRVILSGRSINDGMGDWIAEKIHDKRKSRAGSVLILGVTFKENVPDVRNSKVIGMARRLEWLGHTVTLHDPVADPRAFTQEHGMTLDGDALGKSYDVVIGAVAHAGYRALPQARLQSMARHGGLIVDLKGMWSRLSPLDAREWWSL